MSEIVLGEEVLGVPTVGEEVFVVVVACGHIFYTSSSAYISGNRLS